MTWHRDTVNQILQLLFWGETEVITEVTVLFITAAGGARGIVPDSSAVIDASFRVRFGLETAIQRFRLYGLLLDGLGGVLVALGLGKDLSGRGRALLAILYSGGWTVGRFLRRFLHGGQFGLLVSKPFSLSFSFCLHLR